MKFNRRQIESFIEAMYPDDPKDIELVPNMDQAFLGLTSLPSDSSITVAVYDRDKCVDLVSKDMPEDEAEEHFERNIEGAYVGKPGPLFVTLIK